MANEKLNLAERDMKIILDLNFMGVSNYFRASLVVQWVKNLSAV